MRAMVTGWSRMHGTGKGSGASYDMGRVHILSGIAPLDQPNTKRECGGFVGAELEANERGIAAFKKLNGHKFPSMFELTIENELRFVSSKTGGEEKLIGVVVDAKPAG